MTADDLTTGGKPMSSEAQIIEQFALAMLEQNIPVASQDIIADGQFHRIHVQGDGGLSKNGFYVLHIDDRPAGSFGCNKRYGNEHKFTWSAKTFTPLTPVERRAFAIKMEAQRAEREAKKAAARAAAAEVANRVWAEAAPCTDHPYLTRKGVASHGLRVGRWEIRDRETGEISLISDKALLVPLRDVKKRIRSLQAIFPGKILGGRDKDYLRDGAKEGLFYSFGKPAPGPDGRAVIMIGEGYATLASAHECTGHAAIAAFDAGNLVHVGRAIRARYPDACLLFLADNDQWTTTPVDNPGLTAARAAAAAAGGLVAMPDFGDDVEGKPTDFNDLHQRLGADAVRQAIAAALDPLAARAEATPASSIGMDAKIRPVWLVPSTDTAEILRAGFPADVLSMREPDIAQRIDPRGAMLSPFGDLDGLMAAIKEARKFLPDARLFALIPPELGDEAVKLAHDCGASVEVLQPGVSWVASLWAQTGMKEPPPEDCDVVDFEGDVELSELQQAVCGAVAPARDEDRRREQQDENKRIQEVAAGAMIPSQLTLDEMLERCVYVAEKKFVAYVTDDRSIFLKLDEFRVLTTASKTEIEVMKRDKAVTKMVPTAGLWLLDKRRVDTMTATFRAGAPNITVNPKGLRAVNTWRPTQRWPAKVDISPFLDQVEYLFPDPSERTVFLDWLAHIEQKPGELPHYGWLHVAESTGTGRNWVASVLARVFRGYTAPNVDLAALLDSQFNGELGGCVLAIVDEVQEGGYEGNYQHAQRLKSMINAEMRTVNNKYGMQYLEFNSLRWLVFSNHKNALPINDSDRRFRVVMHKALPRSPAVYERLYALLADPEFVNAVGVYLSERDISGFKPGERPPLNADKIAAIAASKPMSTQGAEEVVAAWPSDVITNKNLVELLTGTTERKEFTPAMRRAMEEVGAQSWHQGKVHKIKIGNSSHRIWVLRNHAKWFMESTGAIREEISRAGVDDLAGRPAAVILADAAERMEGQRDPAF